MFNSDKIKAITTETFDQEVLQAGDTPVVVDFWGKTCAPCKMLAPKISACAEEMSEFKFVSVCIEDNIELARRLNIRAMPTLQLYRQGELLSFISNAGQYDSFVESLRVVQREQQTHNAV